MKDTRTPRPEAAFAFILTALVSIACFMLASWALFGLVINRGENHPSFALLGLILWVISFPHCMHPFYAVFEVILILLGDESNDY
ncbi:MAG: hypothetical protein WCZ86_06155 [Desulfurivibrionaceae bacterium]